jgi:hypothetical protein
MRLKDIIWICQLYNEDDGFRKEIDSLKDENDLNAEADIYYSNECVYPFLPLHQHDYMPHTVIKIRRKIGSFCNEFVDRKCILSSEAKRKIASRIKSKDLDYEERKKWIENMKAKYGADFYYDELVSSKF